MGEGEDGAAPGRRRRGTREGRKEVHTCNPSSPFDCLHSVCAMVVADERRAVVAPDERGGKGQTMPGRRRTSNMHGATHRGRARLVREFVGEWKW